MEALFSEYDAIRRSGLFDPEYYLATYPDVAERNLDPLVHYLEEGAREGRNPHPAFDGAFYLEQCRSTGEQPSNPLIHYLRVGAARGFKTRREAVPAAAGAGTAAPSRQTAAPPPFLVALESVGVIGAVDGGSRISISGWALAPSAIAEIAVMFDGRPVGTAHYGLARPDVARLYPDRDGAGRSGFILAFELPASARGTIEAVLTVRTTAQETGRRPLRIEIPPQQIEAAIVDPLAPEGGNGASRPPVRLGVDAAAVDATGTLRVEGWVVSAVQIESVSVFLGNVLIGEAEFGRTRGDVEKRFPDYPNARFSGFSLVLDARRYAPGIKVLGVRAIARGGHRAEASGRIEIPRSAARPAGEPPPEFLCHWDEAALDPDGRLAVRGWAVGAAPIRSAIVLLDGKEIGAAAIGLDRPDVGNRFPLLPFARQPGFALETRLAPPTAPEHRLGILFAFADGETRTDELPIHASVALRSGGAEAAGSAGPEPEARTEGELKLQIDTPMVIDGAVETPLRGHLAVSGWALARAGVAAIEIAIDGEPTAFADYGLRRLDIRNAFPDWTDSLASGFNALLPHRVLPQGRHTVRVTLRDKDGRSASTKFRIEVEEPSDTAGPWALRRRVEPAETDLVRRILDHRGWHPNFAVLLPVRDDEHWLQQARITVASLCEQAYPHWHLLLLGGGSKAMDTLCAEMASLAGRVEAVRDATPAAIAEIGRRLGGAPDAVFATVLTAGDRLGCDAFLEMAIGSALQRGADFLYSDERGVNPASGAIEAFFKPQWSPDLLLSSNYVGRLWCARADLLDGASEAGESLLTHGEYDLVLRCTERAAAIRHIPAVLCQRGSEAARDGLEAQALTRALARRGIAGEVGEGLVPGTHRVSRTLTKPGLVSILIPTCAARGLIETCIGTLRRLTAYRDYEIVCIENIPAKDRKWRSWLRRNADRVLTTKEPYNWARFSNLAAAEATGEYLLFLNDDIEIIEPDWLETLLAHAQRPEIGVVGPRLLYPDRRVQHAGMFLAAMGQARHAFRYAAPDDPGYFGLAATERDVIAVTGACLMTRRDTFEALGGFDETQAIINNDLDFCLRAWQRGLLNLYTPHATLIHHEAVSRAALDDEHDAAVFESKWRDAFLAGDPFFSPHLSKSSDTVSVEHEPTGLAATGRPVLRREEIRSILAVKLDHIGDCVIAFPALRRLKHHFPDARITVLTSSASLPLWHLEPSVDRTIAFDFFHARSALGELQLSEAEWGGLRERLSRERFDLAIDLRKHLETRPVLQHTGARYLAGFDFRHQFPWLDISLEWGGDQIYARKRQHNGDDLLNLVDAVAAACEPERTLIAAQPAQSTRLRSALKKGGPGPLVCVHPTAGNEMKQWPVEYFAAIIDRLVAEDAARIVLIGAPGDEEVAAALLGKIRFREAVTSLVGKVPLAELPSLLAGMSLFLGNDSGPKHIAAGLGVPTVGIHGGTVDFREWGPVGPAAIAVARSVSCSPCYLSSAEDCRRGLACIRQLDPALVYDACKRLLLLSAPAEETAAAVNGQPPEAAKKPKRRRRPAPAAGEIGAI